MRIRDCTSGDFDALRRMHAAQSFGYPFPDLDSPLFIAKLVLEDDAGADATWAPLESASPAESGAGFSLRGLDLASTNPHRLKPAPRSRPRGFDDSRESAVSRELAASNSAPDEERPQPRHQRIIMAVLLRLTAETYLLHDPHAGTPRQRWQHLLALHEAAHSAAIACGLDDVQAFLPPRIARAFGRRLARLGWTQDPWPCLSRRVP